MSVLQKEDSGKSGPRNRFVSAVQSLPDRCAVNVAHLADQIGADKLDLLNCVRADLEFARLIASKVNT